MSAKKISELTSASLPLSGNELLELSQPSGGVYSSVQADSGTVSYAGVKLGSFYDLTDQTGDVAAATAVKFGSNDIATKGVTVVTDGSHLTRITYAEAGTYMIAPSLQFANSGASEHSITVWFAKNGTAIPNSATICHVPKASAGGAAFFQIVFYVDVAAGDYLQVMWLPTNVAATIDYTSAGAIAPAVPSAIVVTERIDL